MKLGLIENAWWGSSVDRVEGIRLAAKMGFESYDMYTNGLSRQLTNGVREATASAGMPIGSILVLCYSLSDFNPDVRRFSTRWVKKQIELGHELGARILVLALGEYIQEKAELDPAIEWNWAVEGVRELADHSKSLGMKLALEPLPYRFSLVNSVGSIRSFIDDVDHPSVFVNADVSHFFLMGDKPERLRTLGDKVVSVHFSDCNGKQHGDLPPGRGVVPLKEYLRVLEGMGYDGTVSVELAFSPKPEKASAWVAEAYVKTAQIMDELGVRG